LLAVTLRWAVKLIIAFALSFLSFAAATEQTSTSPQGDEAKVYVYASQKTKEIAFRVTASIYLDDKLIAKLPNGRYFLVSVTPGTHSFYGKSKKRGGVEANFEAGKFYYLRLGWEGSLTPNGLSVSPPDNARFDLKHSKPIDEKDIRDPRVRRDSPPVVP
jgi:hypothetical protein